MNNDRSLFDSLAMSPLAMVVSNPRSMDNPLEAVNSAFCALTGYGEADIIGRNCRFLTGDETSAAATMALRDAIRREKPALVEILNYRRDGSSFRNGVMVTPLLGEDERPRWFLGSQVDLGPDLRVGLKPRREAALRRVGDLPPRQRQVLELMAGGLLNKQIAWQLKIAEKTVKMHRALLLEKLGVTTSAEAIRIAVEAGL